MKCPIDHLRYVALAVPDFETESSFLENHWGVRTIDREGSTAYFSADGCQERFILRLRKAESRRTDLYGLGAPDAVAVDSLAAHLKSKGIALVAEPHTLTSPGGGYGIRFFDVDGRLVEVSSDVAPLDASPVAAKSGRPTGLSHVVFHSPDIRKTVAWYEEHLLLRVSDWLDEFMCFMRGSSKKHHFIAFLKGPASLNHIAFEVATLDDMMRGMGRLLRADIKLSWGPGRHTAGDNTFAYFLTPSGNVLEYTAELESVPEDWTPRVFARAPEIIDQWGTGRVSGPAEYPPMAPDPGLWDSATP
jgi:2,3-dihydroxy-p-cumate/2,3-dihydroxybenzoate 3,4-dioxygenase